MSHYKAAIIGLGNIAWRFDNKIQNSYNPLTHAEAYKADSRVLMVGGCSNNPNDRTEFGKQYNIPTFETISDLFKETDPDIVSICTPSDSHFNHLIFCLEQNIPMIWLEKPPASTLDELDILVEKKQHSKSKILVNYIRRYCEPYQKLREVFKKKSLGKAVFMSMAYSKELLLNGSHIIDIAFFITGDNKEASLESVTYSGDIDNPSFTLKFLGGLTAFVNGASLPYHNIDISLTCEQGRASVIHGGMNTRWEVKVEHELFPEFYRLKEVSNNYLGKGGFDGCMITALDDLIRSYEDKREPMSNLQTARSTQELIESINNQRNPQ